MTSTQVRNQVWNNFEQGFNSLHKVADVVTFPLVPLHGAIHGTARGLFNWLVDEHPEDRSRGHNDNNSSQHPQNCQTEPQNSPGQPRQSRPEGTGGNSAGPQNIHRTNNRTGNNTGVLASPYAYIWRVHEVHGDPISMLLVNISYVF